MALTQRPKGVVAAGRALLNCESDTLILSSSVPEDLSHARRAVGIRMTLLTTQRLFCSVPAHAARDHHTHPAWILSHGQGGHEATAGRGQAHFLAILLLNMTRCAILDMVGAD